jgi:hypothetical protein
VDLRRAIIASDALLRQTVNHIDVWWRFSFRESCYNTEYGSEEEKSGCEHAADRIVAQIVVR